MRKYNIEELVSIKQSYGRVSSKARAYKAKLRKQTMENIELRCKLRQPTVFETRMEVMKIERHLTAGAITPDEMFNALQFYRRVHTLTDYEQKLKIKLQMYSLEEMEAYKVRHLRHTGSFARQAMNEFITKDIADGNN